LGSASLPQRLMIDLSHSNSSKQYKKQMEVATEVGSQIAQGDRRIIGVMVESHLVEGRQDLVAGKPLTYGQSVTDACLGWEDSEKLLNSLAESVRKRRQHLSGKAK